ncbi:hypothetical protein HN419_05415 [Candidatus Woesearchaeota archaeon]|jgi:Holliday junction resolvase-like predicted endonuclease|nr:hypothetical protein [Candidatus Woesearchaeota archaeon]MBT3537690.1 hypothetical protein [Candidatus Woesearchaeota archaeon]MBT4697821.1 hypothetical protein [Candidatus Woesearchaeota archaeon]MBT4716923.1 hypothetical protein [Candidatus Woesearchaeota archaeon]MBT7105359.1 hypothetical protein [Candidatus Woesearchaeota archaeon]
MKLYEEIKHRYDDIILNYRIKGRKCSLGEIDLLARKGEVLDLYEVKCSHRIVKARKQLYKARKNMKLNSSNSNLFFYCGSSDSIMSI